LPEALVTGGGRGIGENIARALAEDGYRVTVTGRTRERVESVAAAIGGRALVGDVAKRDDVDRWASEVGDLDVLVCNAGVTRDGLIARLSPEAWTTVIDTNLAGPFFLCQAVSRRMMRRRSGSIVLMSSVVGVHGNAGQTNYAASKAGLLGLGKSLARELGSRNIRVNVIAPGYIATELTGVLSDELRQGILDQTPLGRLGESEDVARAVRFLASDASSFVTGAVLGVDGGLGM
jgi:3-oxoacyl-[acyl-carrier protein] reductase